MLEERLSSAYSYHNIGPYGSAPPGAQSYNNYPAVAQNPPPDSTAGVENYYLSNAIPDQYRPNIQPRHTAPSYKTATPAPDVSNTSPYPALNSEFGDTPSQGPGWNQDNASSVHSPQAADVQPYAGQYNAAPPGPTGASFNRGPGQVASTPQGEGEPLYHQPQIIRRDSQFSQPANSSSPYTSPHAFQRHNESQYQNYPPQGPVSAQHVNHESSASQYPPPPQLYQQPYVQQPPAAAVEGSFSAYPGAQAGATYPLHSQLPEPTAPKPVVEESLIDL